METKFNGVYSRKATMALRGVFGDIVDKVFYVTESRYCDDRDVEKMRKQAKTTHEDKGLFYWDCDDIVVKFTNGRTVYMTNSEWASFTKINEQNFEEIV